MWQANYAYWLVGPKLLYFCTFLLQFSFYAFRSNVFKNYFGFSTERSGWYFCLMAACSFVGISFWSRLVDKTGKPKQVYFALILLSSLFFLPLAFKPNAYVQSVLLGAYSFCIFGMNPILSQCVLQMLDASGLQGNKEIYGRQVLFGSFAYVAVNLVLGPSIDVYGEGAVFYIFSLSALALLAVVYFCFPSDGTAGRAVQAAQSDGKDAQQQSMSERVSLLFRGNSRFAIFLGVIFLTGCARSVMSAFLTLYYRELHLSNTQSTFNLISGVVLETACFYWGPRMARVSAHWMLILAQVAMVIRSWAYVFIPQNTHTFSLLLGIELLKGLAFGLTHLAGVRVACESAPVGLETTAQGFYEGFYSQLPNAFAMPLAGWTLHRFGFEWLFLVTAYGISASCFFVTITFWNSGKLQRMLVKEE